MVSEGVAILVHVIAERQLPEVAAVECDDDAAQETAGAIKFNAEKIMTSLVQQGHQTKEPKQNPAQRQVIGRLL